MNVNMTTGVLSVELDKRVGQPADIASSAYQYRADRKPEVNAPESWLAVMRFAGQPLNTPADPDAPAVKRVLCALLWEEIRPIRQVELTWPADENRRPAPKVLELTTLDHQGAASSWWNNLNAEKKPVKPGIADGGSRLVYDLAHDTCSLIVSVSGDKPATDYAVPAVRVLVADTWKKMDVEIEWGYDAASAPKDYSGRIEAYDGMVGALAPLDDDAGTTVAGDAAWRSSARSGARRGVKASLLYMGNASKWRKAIPFTSQREDVARTIVTVWTKSGNFSFLAADLENGPILAPEYGFFVRRTSAWPAVADKKQAMKDGLTLPVEAVVFGPFAASDPVPAETDLRAVPVALEVGDKRVQGRPAAFDPDNRWIDLAPFTGKDAQSVAWVYQRFTRTTTGPVNLGFGADGWYEAYLDGKLISETVSRGDAGNGNSPPSTCDFTVTVDVTKGEHVLAVRLIRGPGSALLASGEPAPSMRHTPPHDMASEATTAAGFVKELRDRKLETIRQRLRASPERTWQEAVTATRGSDLPPHPTPPAGTEPAMQVQVPCERLTAQWNLGRWHLTRHCGKNPENGRLWFNCHPYGVLAAETYMVLAALDLIGDHQAAEDGLQQWVSLPMQVVIKPDMIGTTWDPAKHVAGSLTDRPVGNFTDGAGCFTLAEGPGGMCGHMDGVHAFGPGAIGWTLAEHFRLIGDEEWLKAHAPRIKANVEWILRQRRTVQHMVPGGERLWSKGLQPALQPSPDSGGLWMQFYCGEAYYWLAVHKFAEALTTIDPAEGARLQAEAEAYRQDLLAAVERTIALSPVVPIRDGTYHSVLPFACYVRGLSTGAWGWLRDGSVIHVGPMYWETVASAATLVSPAGLLAPDDVRVQGYLDVLEDRLLLENLYVKEHAKDDWVAAGWQYQTGVEKTANMHLDGDDVPVFIRSFLNAYAVDILEKEGYTFNEHAVHGPPDKFFEDAAFLERFRNLLVMEQDDTLWLARATPRVWLEQGKKISVKNAPTYFGTLAYEIVSDVDNGNIVATVELPTTKAPKSVLLRFRHPTAAPIQSVIVNGKTWTAFDKDKETVELQGLTGRMSVTARY